MTKKSKPTDRVLTYEEAEEFIRICDAEDARKQAEYVGRLEVALQLQQKRIVELEEALMEMEYMLTWQDDTGEIK
jgi:hypothetical protein